MHGVSLMIVKGKIPIAIYDKKQADYGIVFKRCIIASCWSGRSSDHFSSISACACVSTTGSRSPDSTTEKISERVIWNASQSFSRVGKVGTMFFRYHVEIVVGLMPAWTARSYAWL